MVPDDVNSIAKAAHMLSDAYEVVLTSGGIGPTVDDITIAAIAQAFNLPITRFEHDGHLSHLGAGAISFLASGLHTIVKGARSLAPVWPKQDSIPYQDIRGMQCPRNIAAPRFRELARQLEGYVAPASGG